MSREYRIGPSRLRHGMILGCGLIVFGVWILVFVGDTVPDRQLIGVAALALGAGVGLYAWWTSRTADAVLRIDASGVWFRDWGITVPWPEIGQILHTGHRFQPFVTVQLREPERFFGALPADVTRKLNSGRLWKSPYFRIPNGTVNVTQPELLAALRSALGEYG